MKCPLCNHLNPEKSRFCGKCTAPLKPSDTLAYPHTRATEIPKDILEIGSTFAGRYEILEELGQGGMGRVYRVRDNKINEELALKTLNPEIRDDEATIDRFRNELKYARKISHRNVCRMYDFNEEQECPYITMEYVKGEDLKTLINRMGPLPEGRVIRIAKQVCEGLAEAHRLRVVHRDLKPQNIILDEEDNVRVLDFGLARSLKAKGVSEAGIIIGTPYYMSPEQVEGIEADERADIYSLGVNLYEMVTGKVPFDGDTSISIALKHKTEEPANPKNLNDKVSEDLSSLILRCMTKDREHRYQAVEEILFELRNLEEGMPITTGPLQPHIPAFLIKKEDEIPEIKKPVFVARKRELEKLESFLDDAISGNSRVVFITGEAGSGKTALVQEFSSRALKKHDDLIVASGNCNAHTGIGDPYLPFRDVLGELSGDVEAKWEAQSMTQEHTKRLWNLLPHTVQAIVATGPDLINTLIPGTDLISRSIAFSSAGAAWISGLKQIVQIKASAPAIANPQQNDIFEQYARVLRELAKKHPLVLILDDLHWADSGSISLMFHLSRRIKGSCILILGVYRSADVAQGRDGKRHPLESLVNEIKRDSGDVELDLTEAEALHFLDAFIDLEPNKLGKSFRGKLFRQTQGHPLFTIELLRGMQEQGMLVKDKENMWVEARELVWDALPARVEAVIGERVGRLPENLLRMMAVCSVEGEEFTAEVAAKVLKAEGRDVVSVLSNELDKQYRLVSAQDIRRIKSHRLSVYRFRHNLFQKYLYANLDQAERSYLHEEVGTELEKLYGDNSEEIAVQLARHFQESGIIGKAIHYLNQAGNRAVKLSANEEAIGHLSKGLEILKTQPAELERNQQELQLLLSLGVPLLMTKGYAAPEVEKTYARARELARQVGKTPQFFPALIGLLLFYFVRGELNTARELGEQLFKLAKEAEDPAFLLEAHFSLGYIKFFLGDLVSARENFEQVLKLYDSRQHHCHAFIYGQDPGVITSSYMASTLELMGYSNQALEMNQKALALARDLGNPYSLAFALDFSAVFHHIRREAKEAQTMAEEAIALSTEQGFLQWIAHGMILRGWALWEQGQKEEGEGQIQEGLGAWRATGAGLAMPYYLTPLVETKIRMERAEEGMGVLNEALSIAQANQDGFFVPELHRLKGELLMLTGKTEEEIEKCFNTAIEMARRQNAKILELRATVDFCRFLIKQNKAKEAKDLLKKIYGFFTEGLDTPNMRRAKQLLDELS